MSPALLFFHDTSVDLIDVKNNPVKFLPDLNSETTKP